MYLAHHHPDQYDRCMRVGRSYVCRRCLVLYPLAIVTLVLVEATPAPRALQVGLWLIGPLPAIVELVLEQLGPLRYAPRRQVAVTIPLGLALGCGFGLYLDDHTSLLFWGVVVVDTAVCAAAVFWGQRRAPSRSSV